jgi:hypothetical protein
VTAPPRPGERLERTAQLLGSDVLVYGLDRETWRRRSATDVTLR